MKIYVCDRCGAVKRILNGIVGTEFELHGFGTLAAAFRTADVVDVCGSCMKAAQVALDLAGSAANRVKEAEVRSVVGTKQGRKAA